MSIGRLNGEEQRAVSRGVNVYGIGAERALALWHAACEPDDKDGREGEPADPWDVFDYLCEAEKRS